MCKIGFLKFLTGLGVCSSLCLAPMAHAATVFDVKDNATIHAAIAAQQTTRIAVAGDRIVMMRGVKSAYTFTNDEAQGAVFLKPTRAYRKKPFYLFLSTEQGRNYVLMLQPKNHRKANMLIIKPQEPQKQLAQRWETNSHYVQTLLNLLNDLKQRRIPSGYESLPVNTAPVMSINKTLRLRLQARYQGARLRGDIITVTNHSDQTITLNESDFYQSGDRAICLKETVLAPHAQTQLTKVSVYE